MLESLANGHKKTPRAGGVILADGSKALGPQGSDGSGGGHRLHHAPIAIAEIIII